MLLLDVLLIVGDLLENLFVLLLYSIVLVHHLIMFGSQSFVFVIQKIQLLLKIQQLSLEHVGVIRVEIIFITPVGRRLALVLRHLIWIVL